MIIFTLISKGIELAATAINDYIHRLDNAKDALSETQSEMESTNSEIEETAKQIKELETLDPSSLSITDKEDLQRLKDQNEELRIRQQYLSQQEKADLQKVADLTKEKYNQSYSGDVDRENIDSYKDIYNKKPVANTLPSYLTGESSVQTTSYAASAQNELSQSSEALANLIAQYEHFTEEKKRSIENEDTESIEKYNAKLEETATKLREDRTELQGFSDDLSATGETSPELDEITSKLKLIDDLLLSPGQNLVNFINADSLSDNKEKLVELADAGKLTQEELSKNFTEVDKYLKENGLTLEDLISVVKVYKDELGTIDSDITPTLSISSTIDQLNTKLKPVFDSLKSAYNDIFTDDGFTLENVDLDMLSNVQSVMDEMREVGLGIDTSGFENLAKVLSNSSSTAKEVQGAFDSLASSILNNTDTIENLDDSTADLVVSMLESLGVANAEEIVYDSLNAKTEAFALQKQVAAETGYELVNATTDEITAFLNHAGASETARQYLFQLVAAEQVFNAQGLDVGGKIAKLKELATAYGQTAIAAKIAHMEDQSSKSHVSLNENDYNSLVNEVNSAVNNIKIDFNGVGGGAKSASKAGKEAADKYVEAFEKELQKLDDLKDRGKITEKQYLDQLRSLYNKYYRDKKKYLEQYSKYESQYLSGMKSLYESAFSYIGKQLDKRMDALKKQCDSQIDGLETQKKAVEEYYQGQIDAVEDEIKAIDKQIKAKQEIIDKINEEAEARQRDLDLQKAEHDLARMQNQKTTNVLTKDGMVYKEDTTGIRDAKEKVDDIKREEEIAAIEKEIDGLEKQKDILDEQKQALEEALDASNAYWDAQIEKTQTYFDSLTSGLEDYKSRWEELGEIAENAKMQAALEELGITEQDIMNMSEETFQRVKESYLGVLKDMHSGNDMMMQQLSELSGVDMSGLTGYLDSTKGSFDDLGSVSLENLNSEIDTLNENVSGLSESSSQTSSAVEDMGAGISKASENITPLNSDLETLKSLLQEIKDIFSTFEFPQIGDEDYAQKLNSIADGFKQIADKCKEFSNIDFSSIIGSAGDVSAPSLGGEENANGSSGSGIGGLVAAITDAVTVIDEQMNSLSDALQAGNDAFAEQIAFITEEYIPAWEDLQTRLAEIIGVGGGGGDSKGGDKKSGGKGKKDKQGGSESGSGDGSIIDTMQTGGEEVANKLQDPWLTAFNDFATGDNSVQSICDKIRELVEEMANSITEQCAKAAQALNDLADKALNSSASIGTGSSFTGKAHAKGSDGLPTDEKNALVGEVAPELVCDPETGQYSLFTEPTITDLNKGTIVYNGEQTKDILSRKNSGGVTLGNAFREGTVVRNNGDILVPLDRSDSKYAWMNKFERLIAQGEDLFIPPSNAMFNASEAMNGLTKVINNNNPITQTQHNTYNVTIPNVTNESSALKLVNELKQLPRETYQYINRK